MSLPRRTYRARLIWALLPPRLRVLRAIIRGAMTTRAIRRRNALPGALGRRRNASFRALRSGGGCLDRRLPRRGGAVPLLRTIRMAYRLMTRHIFYAL